MEREQAEHAQPVQLGGHLLQRYELLCMQPASGCLAAVLGQCPDQLVRRTGAGWGPALADCALAIVALIS